MRQEGLSPALLEEVHQQDGAAHVERGRPEPQVLDPASALRRRRRGWRRPRLERGRHQGAAAAAGAHPARSCAGCHRPTQSWQHVLHERRAAVPLAHRHPRRVLRPGPVQGRPVAPQQAQLEEVRHEGRDHRAARAAPQGDLELPVRPGDEHRVQERRRQVRQPVPRQSAARRPGVPPLAARQSPRGSQSGDQEEVQDHKGELPYSSPPPPPLPFLLVVVIRGMRLRELPRRLNCPEKREIPSC